MMRTDLDKLSTLEGIRSVLLENSSEDVKDTTSKLTIPLNSANRSVSSAIATIGLLPPESRKAASLTLIDISEAALKAVEKTLRRSGTEDSSLLQKLRRIIKLIEAFEEDFFRLTVTEDESIDGVDPEASEEEIPPEFDNGLPNQEISALAIRVLKDNSDMDDAEMGEGDPEEDVPEPIEGEATDVTVDPDASADAIINTIADSPKEDGLDNKLPPEFISKGTNESIHKDPSHNLSLLNILMRTM